MLKVHNTFEREENAGKRSAALAVKSQVTTEKKPTVCKHSSIAHKYFTWQVPLVFEFVLARFGVGGGKLNLEMSLQGGVSRTLEKDSP